MICTECAPSWSSEPGDRRLQDGISAYGFHRVHRADLRAVPELHRASRGPRRMTVSPQPSSISSIRAASSENFCR
jgi:hypothetical protein